MSDEKEKKIEVSKEAIYWKAMDEFLKLRGELSINEGGYKQDIITKSSIIKYCYFPLRECGFFPPKSKTFIMDGTDRTFIETTLKHMEGHTESEVTELVPWTIYPDSHDKQRKAAFDQQCSITYIERQHLISLLFIQDGFNPEKQAFDKDVKAGNVILIDDEKVAHIRSLLMGNDVLKNKVMKAYNVSGANEIKESDHAEILTLINNAIGEQNGSV